MRIPRTLVFVAFGLALGAPPLAAQRAERTISVPRGATITLENSSGSITVTGSGRSDIAVLGDRDLQRELSIKIDGLQIKIEASSNDMEVRMPANVRLLVNTESGSVSISGVTGSVETETSSGDIDIVGTPQTLRATSLSGEITAEGGLERTNAESISGTVVLSRARGIVDAKSTSGAVRVLGREIKEAHLSSVSGSVVFAGTPVADARIEAESSSGSVELRLPDNYPAQYDLTSIDGHIENDYGPRPARTRSGEGATLRFSNGGGGRVLATTVSGSIHLQGQ